MLALMRKAYIFIFFILLSCSKDSPIPDAPTVKYTLTVTASEGGNVDTTGGTHNENTSVSITATADAGYEFTSWSGDASGTDNPLTISMNSNKTITANFIRTQYTLSVGKIGEGSITQEELANLIGISRQAINAIEKEKFDPSLPTAFKMSKLFKISIEELFFFEGSK